MSLLLIRILKKNITGRLESLEPMEQGSAYVNVGVMPNAVIDVSRVK